MTTLDMNEITDVGDPISSTLKEEKKNYIVYDRKKKPKILSLTEILLKLENNKGYNIKTDYKENYMLYGKLNNYNQETKSKLINYYKEYCGLDVKSTEIKIIEHKLYKTKNYIYTIPKYYCTGSKLKAIHESLIKVHPNMVDIYVYNNKEYYLPYQSKYNNNNYKCLIEKGLPKDFIISNTIGECIEHITIENGTYYKKLDALKKLTDKRKILVSSDYSTKGMKQFNLLTYDELWNVIQNNKKNNYYENFEKDEPLRLFIDVDYKIKNNIICTYDELLNKVMNTIDDELEKYNIKEPQKIILSSNRKDKNSAHIIYPKVYFKSITHMKYFMMNIKSPLITEKILDPSVYKVGCFRLYLNSKKGVNVPLTYYKGIKYKYVDEKTTFFDTLLKNIYTKEEEFVPITIQTNVQIKSTKIKSIKEIKTKKMQKIPIDELRMYLNLLGKEHGEHYADWIKIGMIIYNCNSTEEGFNLWDEWSKRFTTYEDRDTCATSWNTFQPRSMGIYTLRKFAKESNPEEYNKILNLIEGRNFDTIKYEKEFNLDKINGVYDKIKDRHTIVTKNIDDWLTKDYKTLAIRAPYGTGKTTIISSILKEYNPKKVLFLSYRQSLSHSLHGTFRKYKFKNYLDKDYDANRLICQLESIKNIEINGDYAFGKEIEMPTYDIIIMDEIESILNHFVSPTVTDKEYTYDLLYNMCHNSKKILALDGDFDNRGFDYINNFGKSIILENTIKKNKNYYTFTNNQNFFTKDIEDKLINKKKIVIISMTSKLAIYYYELLKDRYKCIIHNSFTDDEIKEKLKDVENYWNTCDVLIYTPSVEAGVDFNLDYFDYKYIILSAKSCSPRALCQMVARVRKTSNNNVLTYLGKMKYSDILCEYTYDEVKGYISEICNKYKKPISYLNKKTNKYCVKYDESPFTRLIIFNEQEKLNKQRNFFVPQLIKLLRSKGHFCKLMKDEYITSDVIENHHINNILNAEDIDREEFNMLKMNQLNGTATKKEKYMIEKYLYKSYFHMNNLNYEFMKTYYGKIHVLTNLKLLVGHKFISVEDELMKGMDIGIIQKKEQCDIVLDFISKLGFDINKIGQLRLDKSKFIINMFFCKSNCRLLKETQISNPLFEIDKNKKNENNELNVINTFMRFSNKILKNWGIKIESKKIRKQIKKEKINSTCYSLSYYKYFDKFINPH